MWKWLKRWPVLLALLVVLGGLAVAVVFLLGPRVTPENCQRIKEGMTEAEVRAILGKPFDDSLLDPEPSGCEFQWWVPLQEDGSSELTGPACNYFWVGGNLVLFVVFDHNGRVVSKDVASGPECPRSSWVPARVWRRLRARYGW
jgi:hypothetical protein